MTSKLTRRAGLRCSLLLAPLLALFATSSAFAADPYTGQIGRIDTRTGHADTSVYRNSIIVRDTNSSVICVVDESTAFAKEFLSVATAAKMAGATVTLERGGALNGQFKCYQIQVRR
jgi:hypothetical protein